MPSSSKRDQEFCSETYKFLDVVENGVFTSDFLRFNQTQAAFHVLLRVCAAVLLKHGVKTVHWSQITMIASVICSFVMHIARGAHYQGTLSQRHLVNAYDLVVGMDQLYPQLTQQLFSPLYTSPQLSLMELELRLYYPPCAKYNCHPALSGSSSKAEASLLATRLPLTALWTREDRQPKGSTSEPFDRTIWDDRARHAFERGSWKYFQVMKSSFDEAMAPKQISNPADFLSPPRKISYRESLGVHPVFPDLPPETSTLMPIFVSSPAVSSHPEFKTHKHQEARLGDNLHVQVLLPRVYKSLKKSSRADKI